MFRRKTLKRFLSIFLIALLVIPTGWIPVAAETSMESDDPPNVVYHETFADGQGLVQRSGGPNLSVVHDKVFDGNDDGSALYLSNRTNNYDGADLLYSELRLEDGHSYTITVSIFVDEDENSPEGSQAIFQHVGGDNYSPHINPVDLLTGEAVILTSEFTVDMDLYDRVRILTNDEGQEVPFYIGDILITSEESAPSDEVVVYHETFEAGVGVARESGDANIEHVTNKVFAGNEDGAAIYVSDRSNDWDAADFFYTDIGVEIGKTYEISVSIYVDDEVEVPEGGQAVMQPVADGEFGDWISNIDYQAGESLVLSGEFTAESDHNRIRVQSNPNGATVPFYIGEVLIVEKVGAEEPGDPDEEFVPFVIADFNFEDSEQGFGPNGTATVSRTNEDSFEGEYSLKVTDRGGEEWHGARVELAEHIYHGATYNITGYVKAINDIEEPTQFKATVDNDSYTTFAEANIETNEWTKFEGTFVNHDNLDSIPVYFESADTDLAFYLDNIIVEIVAPGSDENIVRPPAKEFTLIDFEDGDPNGFEGRGDDDTVTVTNEANHTEGGQFALKSEGRTANWNGPSLEVTDFINVGEEYEISVWVKVASSQSATLQLSTQVGDGSGAAYNNITSKSVTPEDGWVLLEGTYRYTSLGGGYVTIYVEADNLTDFYIDDVNFQELDSEPIEVDLDLTPIKDVYPFLIGNAVSLPDFEGPRLELLNHHHNLVTAENAMKPGDLYDGTEFDFSGANRLVERVVEEDLTLHGHVLVWHQQSPDWLWEDDAGNPLDREEALKNMKRHIRTVMEHFEEQVGDRLISWDVVNEALDGNWDNPEDWESNLRNTGWFQAIGKDYIYEAFKYARQVADEMDREDLILYYNDYNDHLQPKAETMYYMIKDLNERYAEDPDNQYPERPLISGVGMQGHYTINLNPELVRMSIERFKQLGIEIGITELDVTTITENELVEREINRQGYVYASLFQIFKEHADSISRVTFWGLNDSSSWRSDRFPLLFDDRLKAKPAYYAVVDPDDFLANYEEEEIEKNHGYAVYGTPEIDAEIDEIWTNAPTLNINRYQGAWESGATGTGQVLWDEDYLYVLFDVNDPVLDATGSQAHEQDSVETFVNETGEFTLSYIDGVGQYRVSYLNETSFNPTRYSEGVISETRITESGYIVEMAIPWKVVTPEAGHTIGFELQINDAENGSRIVATAWNDLTGQGFQDPSVFGELTLVETLDDVPEEPEEVEIQPNEPVVIKPGQNIRIPSEDGQVARISIPETLPENTTIEVAFLDEEAVEDAVSNANKPLTKAGQVVQIELDLPEDFEADEDDLFTLTLEYDTSKNWVAIFRLNEETGVWERLGGEMDSESGTITINISHFSTYGVFEDSVEDVIADLEELIEELNNRIDHLEENVEDLENEIADLRAIIEGLAAEQEGLYDLINDLLARIEALEERLADLEQGDGTDEDNETPGDRDDKGSSDDDDASDEGDTSEDDEQSTDDETSDDDEVIVEDETDEDKAAGEGKEIPKTATNTYNWLLLGGLLLLAGSIYLLVSKRKRA